MLKNSNLQKYFLSNVHVNMMLTALNYWMLQKIFCLILVNFCFLGFAGFADLPAAKGTYFAGAGGKRNYRQNGMYTPQALNLNGH